MSLFSGSSPSSGVSMSCSELCCDAEAIPVGGARAAVQYFREHRPAKNRKMPPLRLPIAKRNPPPADWQGLSDEACTVQWDSHPIGRSSPQMQFSGSNSLTRILLTALMDEPPLLDWDSKIIAPNSSRRRLPSSGGSSGVGQSCSVTSSSWWKVCEGLSSTLHPSPPADIPSLLPMDLKDFNDGLDGASISSCCNSSADVDTHGDASDDIVASSVSSWSDGEMMRAFEELALEVDACSF